MRWMGFLAIFTFSLAANSYELKSKDYLVSLDRTGFGQQWEKNVCSAIHAGVNSVTYSNTLCLKTFGRFIEPEVVEAKKSNSYEYHISIRKIEFPNVLVTVDNLKPYSDVDFNYVSYKVDFTDTDKFLQAMYRLSRNINNYEVTQKSLHNVLDKVFEADLNRYEGETYATKVDFKTVIIEAGAALGFGAFWYYADDTNENDWDLESGIIDSLVQKAKGHSARYDDNSKMLNVGHAFAGMIYHQIGRANGMSQRQAFITSFALSAAWEGLVEYREILSINDTVLTGISGPVIGEVLFQMGRALRHKDSPIARALGIILDSPSAVNQWMGRNQYVLEESPGSEDEFNFELGWSKVALQGEVWNLPEGEKVSAYLPQGFYTKLNAGAEFGSGLSIEEFNLLTKIAFMGYTKRNMQKNSDGSYSGYEFIISAASEFDWQDRPGDDDYMVHARVLGTSVVLNAEYKGTRIQANYEFYGDFALLRSYALKSYLEDNDNSLQGFPGVVQKEQYYYGFGTTQKAGLSLGRGRITIGADYEYNDIRAIKNRDRYQESVTIPFRATDKSSIFELWMEFEISPRLSAVVSMEEEKRSGTLYAYRRSNTERSVHGTIKFKF